MDKCEACGHIRYKDDPFEGTCNTCITWAFNRLVALGEFEAAVRPFIEQKRFTNYPYDPEWRNMWAALANLDGRK